MPSLPCSVSCWRSCSLTRGDAADDCLAGTHIEPLSQRFMAPSEAMPAIALGPLDRRLTDKRVLGSIVR